jgi:hypothetical protein
MAFLSFIVLIEHKMYSMVSHSHGNSAVVLIEHKMCNMGSYIYGNSTIVPIEHKMCSMGLCSHMLEKSANKIIIYSILVGQTTYYSDFPLFGNPASIGQLFAESLGFFVHFSMFTHFITYTFIFLSILRHMSKSSTRL